jgi:hypothetical protein
MQNLPRCGARIEEFSAGQSSAEESQERAGKYENEAGPETAGSHALQ